MNVIQGKTIAVREVETYEQMRNRCHRERLRLVE